MKKIYITLIVILFIGIFLVFCYYQNNALQVTKIYLNKNLKNPIKIVHLSDLHGKEFGNENSKLINKVLKLKPNLIVVTGDLIDMNGKNINEMISLLSKLNKNVPVYYILGNHEHRLDNLEELIKKVESEGVKLLSNEIDTVNINNNEVNILGLDENQASYEDYKKRKQGKYEYKDYKDMFKELEGKSGVKLLLSHYPENFSLIGDKSYKQYNFDLMMSGHAHGGQFILPFVGGLYAPFQGVLPKYYRGLYKEEGEMVVSRGLGASKFPLRLFNRPEVILIEMK